MVQKLLTTNPHNYGLNCLMKIKQDSLKQTSNACIKCLHDSNYPYRTSNFFVENLSFMLYFLETFHAPMPWCGQISFENLLGFAGKF